MRDKRQVLWGIIIVLISISLIAGAAFISLAEGKLRQPTKPLPSNPTRSQTPFNQPTGTRLPTITLPFPYTQIPRIVSPTRLPSISVPTPTPSPTPSLLTPETPTRTPSLTPTRTSSGTPTYLSSPTTYLPPPPTQTTASCGAPSSWVIYIVQPGDTLYHLGQIYGISYKIIQRANCLTNSIIYVGQRLFVPPWPARTPSPTLYFPIFPSDTPLNPWIDTPTEIPSSTP